MTEKALTRKEQKKMLKTAVAVRKRCRDALYQFTKRATWYADQCDGVKERCPDCPFAQHERPHVMKARVDFLTKNVFGTTTNTTPYFTANEQVEILRELRRGPEHCERYKTQTLAGYRWEPDQTFNEWSLETAKDIRD